MVNCVHQIENKELLQHTAMDTRMSTRNRHGKQQRNNQVETKKKHSRNDYSSSDTDYSASPIQKARPKKIDTKSGNQSKIPVQGSLIIIPPFITHFITKNIHNPESIRSLIGDYYWQALCTPMSLDDE